MVYIYEIVSGEKEKGITKPMSTLNRLSFKVERTTKRKQLPDLVSKKTHPFEKSLLGICWDQCMYNAAHAHVLQSRSTFIILFYFFSSES